MGRIGERGAHLGKWLGRFALVHPINVILSTLYALLQLLVFARVLDTDRLAEVILIATIGMILLPLNQAAGRTNYVSLREDVLLQRPASNWPQVRYLLFQQLILVLLISVVAPAFIPVADGHYVENVLLLAAALTTNYTLNDVQITLWAFDLNVRFVYILILRSILQYICLGFLIFNDGLFYFAAFSFAVNCIVIIYLYNLVEKNINIKFDRNIGMLKLWWNHKKKLFSLLVLSVSEMVVLTLPYVLLTISFGVGPALITYDVIMKFVRVITAGGRMTTEVALPQITRDLIAGKAGLAWRRYVSIIGLCVAASIVLAAALVFFGKEIFTLLLGPNNVVPEGAGYVAGVIVITAAIFQPSHYIVSVANSRSLIWRFALVVLLGFAVFSLSGFIGLSILGVIWVYACYFGLASLSLVILARQAIFGWAHQRGIQESENSARDP